MLDKQFDTLVERLRNALLADLTIAVAGWIAKNHNAFTKKLSKKKIRFYSTPPSDFGDRTGYALFTEYVDHADFVRIKQANPVKVHPHILEVKDIRNALKACEDIFFAPRPRGVIPANLPPKAPVAGKSADETLVSDEGIGAAYEFATRPKGDYEMTEFDHLTQEFLKEAAKRDDCAVGSRTLSRTLKRLHIKRTPQWLSNEKHQWLVPLPAEKKTGWYKAGPLMIEASRHEKFAPDDPYGRVKHIIAGEEELKKEKEQLEAHLKQLEAEFAEKLRLAQFAGKERLEKVIQELADVEEAKVLLKQFDEFANKKK